MSIQGCDARVSVGDVQVKCGSTVWRQPIKGFESHNSSKQVFCGDCHQQWETLAEKLEIVMLEGMNGYLPEWWEKITKGHSSGR